MQVHYILDLYSCAADSRSDCRLLLLQLTKKTSTIFAEIKFLGCISDPRDFRVVINKHRLAELLSLSSLLKIAATVLNLVL